MRKKILVCVLFTLVLLIGCKKNEVIQPISFTQQQAFNYLPGQTHFIIYLNLNKLRKTGFWDSYFKSSLMDLDQSGWLGKFENETGAGLDNGISEIFLASGQNSYNTGIAVFDKNLGKIKKHFQNTGIYRNEQYKGKAIYISKEKYPINFYFINDSMLLASANKYYIRSIISGKNIPLKNNPRLTSLIKNIRNKDQYWIASDKGNYALSYVKNFFDITGKIPVNRITRSIKGVTLAADFGDGLEIESNLNCSNSKNAYLLSTGIKGALAMDLLSGGDHSLGKILQKTDVEAKSSQVNLQLILDDNEVNTLKDFTKKRNIESKL